MPGMRKTGMRGGGMKTKVTMKRGGAMKKKRK